MKYIIGLLGILLPVLSGAQSTSVKPLNIGDTVPDITITNVYNYPSSIIRLSDLKHKLVILDFMSTGCVPCIKVLPKLDSLQMQYESQVQIILLSTENPARIQSFLKKYAWLHIPFVAADTSLSKLFPHEYISHISWIDPSGIVKAITHSEYINAKNIEALLNGNKVNWPVKNDIAFFDFKQSLLLMNQRSIPELSLPANAFYSSLLNYMPGIQKHNEIDVDTLKKVTHTSFINYSIIDLYLLLFRRFYFPKSHVLLQVKDTGRLVYNPAKGYFDNWQKQNFYSIDAMLPASTPLLLQHEKLISDCNFYWGLQASMEKRTVDCLVLKNKKKPVLNRSSEPEGLRIGMICYLLNNEVGAIPVIDETTGTTYTTIPISEQQVKDTAYLKKILSHYGFELFTEKRDLEFLVITQPE